MVKIKQKQRKKSNLRQTQTNQDMKSDGPTGGAEHDKEKGRALRKQTPRSSHGEWHPSIDRRDPVEVLIESSADRVPHLLPIRYERMLASPFAFFRGAAAVMAADLSTTPATGLQVQACGDCHVMNFGVFATPERRLIFDINDFDETLSAPWEWDVKRLAASLVIVGRHNGFRPAQQRAAAADCVRSYRKRIMRYADMAPLDVWYERVDIDALLKLLPARAFDAHDLREMHREPCALSVHEHVNFLDPVAAPPCIRDIPPLVYHPVHAEAQELMSHLREGFGRYRHSLPDERRVLLDRYKLVDHAVKVVGVGSVGTRCGVLLLVAEPNHSLILQVKEARASVLEPYAGKSGYENHGQRVVVGQRLMQAASDLFLGWTRGDSGRDFYVRQQRDVKIKPQVEQFDPATLSAYAVSCGWVLARAHARSGSPRQISAYLGTSDRFENALCDFAESYADQNEQDFDAFKQAAASGRVPVGAGEPHA